MFSSCSEYSKIWWAFLVDGYLRFFVLKFFLFKVEGTRGPGRSRKTWEQCVRDDMKMLAWFAS